MLAVAVVVEGLESDARSARGLIGRSPRCVAVHGHETCHTCQLMDAQKGEAIGYAVLYTSRHECEQEGSETGEGGGDEGEGKEGFLPCHGGREADWTSTISICSDAKVAKLIDERATHCCWDRLGEN